MKVRYYISSDNYDDDEGKLSYACNERVTKLSKSNIFVEIF
jgi:hypothetical protein